MRLADQMLLAQIREALLGHIPDQQWALVEQEVEKAGGVDNVDGYTGVLLRDAIEKAKKNKVETVMSEFKAGKLKSSSGKKVKSRKQAIAIALSEQRRVKKEMLEKASFGGDRSEAGRYAANVRWQSNAGRKRELGEKYPKARAVVDLPSPTGTRSAADTARIKANVDAAKQQLADQKEIKSLRNDIEYAREQIARAEKENNTDVVSRWKQVETNLNTKLNKILERVAPEMMVSSDKPSKAADSFSEDDFDKKGALYGLKDNPTYKKGVEARKAEVKRGDDGVARFRGSDLKQARQNLKDEEDMLEMFESKKATPRRILGSQFNRTDARAILHARVASARATVQALEEFEDETSPGFLAS